MKGIVFLDIDGVVNFPIEDGRQAFDRESCRNLERLRDWGVRFVLSSSWRHRISRNLMVLRGFEVLLSTHGIHSQGMLVGMTGRDLETRAAECRRWIGDSTEPWVALDDVNDGFTENELVLVDTARKLDGAVVEEVKAKLTTRRKKPA